jgi:FkbM family methyltransferase
MFGQRNFKKALKALFGKQHYIAFFNSLSVYLDFYDSLIRYLFGQGSYPTKIKIRTPLGVIAPEIFSYYDMLTVNEIFCRHDYPAGRETKVVVDVGSNIGISALYFLTRNVFSKCYLFEPVPENIYKLKNNLKNFQNRYILEEAATDADSGVKKFGVEPFGRCGGLSRETGEHILVKCKSINKILEEILKKEERIDILKIDTEGNEFEILKAIEKRFFKKISKIYVEIDYSVIFDNKVVFSEYNQFRYGNTLKLELI